MSKDPKVIFVGQSLYFAPHVPHTLPGYELQFIEYVAGVTPPEVLAGQQADVLIFFRGELVPPAILETMKGRKVFLSTEPVPLLDGNGRVMTSTDRAERMGTLVNARGRFDLYFHYDRASLGYLSANGFEGIQEFVLPVNLSTLASGKRRSVARWTCLLLGKETSYRAWMTGPLKHRLQDRFCHAAHGFDVGEVMRLAARSQTAINVHVDDLPTVEPRLQYYMAMGLPVFSEPLSHDTLFQPNVHYVPVYGPDDLEARVLELAGSPAIQEIAGQADLALRTRLDARKVWPLLIQEALA